MDWFSEQYDQSCSATPVLIHKTAVLHHKASGRPGTQIITFDRLSELRDAVTKYAAALAADNAFKNSDEVAKQLATRHLNAKQFIQHWGPHRRSREVLEAKVTNEARMTGGQ